MAFVFPDLSSVHCFSKFCLRYAYMALAAIPAVILLYFIIKKNFIKFFSKDEQASYLRQRKNQRTIFFALRAAAIFFLMVAISSPFIMETTSVKGNPRITILVDNSSSLNLFESGLEKELSSALKNKIPVSVRHIASGDKSALGDGILNNLERDDNVLVITDGNSNEGKLLGDTLLLA